MPFTPSQEIFNWVAAGLAVVVAAQCVSVTARMSRRKEEMAGRRLWNWAHPVQTVVIRVLVACGFLLAFGLFLMFGLFFGLPAWTMLGALTIGAGCTTYMWIVLRGPVDPQMFDEPSVDDSSS